MAKNLIDLLWWNELESTHHARRGPQSRWTTPDVARHAITLADAGGLDAVSMRALANALEITPMSVYTHVNSRDDLLVLMADRAHTSMIWTKTVERRWRERLRIVAEDNLALLLQHPWLLEIDDPRLSFGPGTIAKYDRELHVFDGTALSDVDRDAALTFVLDFAAASASRMAASEVVGDFGAVWEKAAEGLAVRIGDDYPLARRVGAAAGAEMGAPYGPREAWKFGLARVIAGLAEVIEG